MTIFTFQSAIRLWGLLFFFMAIAVFSVYSDTTATADSPLLSLLRKNYSPETALSAKFALTIYWSVREKKETKKGRIILAPGDRFRVTVDKETFVSDGETFRQYSAGTNQLVVKRLADVDRSTLPSQIFARCLAAYPFRVVERKKGLARFAWTSDSAGTPYKEIRVEVQEKARRITRCVLTDNNGNTFTYDFTATVFGETFPKGRFAFDVPKNARIVDMRK